ncbi:hypothetical protein ACJ41O_014657 [Fusarium nematophilum]
MPPSTMEKLEKDTKKNNAPDIGNDVCHDIGAVEAHPYKTEPTQDLFSAEKGDVNFRGVSWQAAAVLIAKFQIGLGALSLPSTFHVLGFFPGIFCFIVISLISAVAGYLCGNARQ